MDAAARARARRSSSLSRIRRDTGGSASPRPVPRRPSRPEDEALLPTVYWEVGAALHVPPTGLGALSLYRSFVQAACYPLAAYAAVRYNRAHVIAVGVFLWAAATFLVAVSGTFAQ